MMRTLFKGLGIAAAAAMLTTTTAASAETATITAPATERADGASDLHSGVGSTTLIEIGILAALTAIVLVATRNDSKGNGSPRPNSP